MGAALYGGHALGEADVLAIVGNQASMAAPLVSSTEERTLASSPWQHELRRRQSRWRERQGYPIGQHNGRPLCSRLAMPEAEQKLWNFLTPAIGELARREYADNASRPRQERKVYGYPRLFDNLLSSQPLAFNLFGELKLDPTLADAAARRLWPDRVDRVTSIEFEWSPGRWNPRYLDNGSAADVAIFHTTPAAGRGVIMLETKYHEDLRGKDYQVKPRYLEVAHKSGVFSTDGLAGLQRGNLQQIWLDHLLALATRDADQLDTTLFVLLAPKVNERCRAAVAAYQAALDSSATPTFESRTLEEVVSVLDGCASGQWVQAFRERYLVAAG